ncbi:RRS1-domain-containing protein, partial [Microstroma glucosiphilum]
MAPTATSSASAAATGSNASSNFQYDHGLLSVTNVSSTSTASKPTSSWLQAQTQKGVSALLSNLIATLPLKVHPDHGPILTLPLPTTILPRAKPLPKPKPLTKWQEFAKKKGIADTKKKEGKLVYDEATQEWVPKWGYKGNNKKEEEQWIHEVPFGKDDDYDPSKAMKAERKKRRLHNDAQRLRNLARASAASSSNSKTSSSALKSDPLTTRTLRKGDLDATTLRMRGSTASMGKFDRVLPGEDIKTRGVKRSFDPNERDAGEEKKRSMAILGGLDGSG